MGAIGQTLGTAYVSKQSDVRTTIISRLVFGPLVFRNCKEICTNAKYCYLCSKSFLIFSLQGPSILICIKIIAKTPLPQLLCTYL